jgi:hypothetical protein
MTVADFNTVPTRLKPLLAKKNRTNVFLVAGALLCILIAHIFFIAPIISETNDYKARIEQKDKLIEKYRKRLGEAKSNAEDPNMDRLSDFSSRFVAGAGQSALAAEIEVGLSSISGGGINKNSFRPLPEKDRGEYKEVSFRYDFTADVRGAHNLLTMLKNFDHPLVIQDFRLRTTGRRRRGLPLNINVTLASIGELKTQQQ